MLNINLLNSPGEQKETTDNKLIIASRVATNTDRQTKVINNNKIKDLDRSLYSKIMILFFIVLIIFIIYYLIVL